MLDIKRTPEGVALIAKMMEQVTEKRGDLARDVKMGEEMQLMMDAMTLEKMLGMAGDAIGPEQALQLNRALNSIKKPE
jgi:hypothetical protein